MEFTSCTHFLYLAIDNCCTSCQAVTLAVLLCHSTQPMNNNKLYTMHLAHGNACTYDSVLALYGCNYPKGRLYNVHSLEVVQTSKRKRNNHSNTELYTGYIYTAICTHVYAAKMHTKINHCLINF